MLPGLVLMLALAWTFGRVAWANGHLEAGTRDAARVASARWGSGANEAGDRLRRFLDLDVCLGAAGGGGADDTVVEVVIEQPQGD